MKILRLQFFVEFKDYNAMQNNYMILTGSQGPLQVLTVAWKTKKFESGILNA